MALLEEGKCIVKYIIRKFQWFPERRVNIDPTITLPKFLGKVRVVLAGMVQYVRYSPCAQSGLLADGLVDVSFRYIAGHYAKFLQFFLVHLMNGVVTQHRSESSL